MGLGIFAGLLFLTTVTQGPALAPRKWQQNPRKARSLLNLCSQPNPWLNASLLMMLTCFSFKDQETVVATSVRRDDLLSSPTLCQMSSSCTKAGLHETLKMVNSWHQLEKQDTFSAKHIVEYNWATVTEAFQKLPGIHHTKYSHEWFQIAKVTSGQYQESLKQPWNLEPLKALKLRAKHLHTLTYLKNNVT